MGKRRPVSYSDAPDASDIVENLIENDPEHFHLSECRVKVFFRSHGLTCGAKAAMATIQLLGKRSSWLIGADILIEVDELIWETLSEEQQVALMDHELYHIALDEESGNLTTVGHDLEEFNRIGEKYGSIFSDIGEFVESVMVGEANG